MTDPASHDSPSERDVSDPWDFNCFPGGADDSSHLRNLLAVIHGDGGHRTYVVGVAQSCRDAVQVLHALRHGGPMPAPVCDRCPEPPTAACDACLDFAHTAHLASGFEHSRECARCAAPPHNRRALRAQKGPRR